MTSGWVNWCTGDHGSHKYEFWQDAVRSSVIEADLSVESQESFDGTMFSQTASDVRLVNFSCGPHIIRRTGAQARRHGRDGLMVSLQCAGQAALTQRDTTQIIAPGEFGVLNAGASFEVMFPADTKRRLLLLPDHLFGPTAFPVKCLDQPAKIASDSPFAPLLAQTILLLTNVDGSLGERVKATLISTVVELIAAQFHSTEGMATASKSSAELSFHSLKRYVDLHITNPDLSPATAAAASKISVRTLHRLFARYLEMGFESYVVEARLKLTFAALQAARVRTVSEAAYACGFNNVSHFTKRFSERFGISPIHVLKGQAPERCD